MGIKAFLANALNIAVGTTYCTKYRYDQYCRKAIHASIHRVLLQQQNLHTRQLTTQHDVRLEHEGWPVSNYAPHNGRRR